jgi:hypothetical protein
VRKNVIYPSFNPSASQIASVSFLVTSRQSRSPPNLLHNLSYVWGRGHEGVKEEKKFCEVLERKKSLRASPEKEITE